MVGVGMNGLVGKADDGYYVWDPVSQRFCNNFACFKDFLTKP